jgi:tetratricopeptide (TPR) repeat protein
MPILPKQLISLRRILPVLTILVVLVAVWRVGDQLQHMDRGFFQPSARGVQGLVLYLVGYYRGAATAYRAHFTQNAGAGGEQAANSEQALLQGDPVTAEAIARTRLAQEPEHFDARLDLGQSRLQLGDHSGATEAVALLAGTYPNDPDRLVLSSLIATHAHEYDVALRDINLVLRNRQTASRHSLFILLMDTVGELIDVDASRRPFALVATYLRYLRMYDRSQGQAVIRYAEQAIARNDHPGEAYLCIGIVYDKEGDVDRALTAFLQAVESQPALAVAYWWASIEYGKKGDLANEFRMALMAAHAQPGDDLYEERVTYVLVEKLGDYRQALQRVHQQLEIGQSSASALGRIGYLHSLLGEFREAVTYYNQAIAIEPKEPRYHDGLGYSLGNLDLRPCKGIES